MLDCPGWSCGGLATKGYLGTLNNDEGKREVRRKRNVTSQLVVPRRYRSAP